MTVFQEMVNCRINTTEQFPFSPFTKTIHWFLILDFYCLRCFVLEKCGGVTLNECMTLFSLRYGQCNQNNIMGQEKTLVNE